MCFGVVAIHGRGILHFFKIHKLYICKKMKIIFSLQKNLHVLLYPKIGLLLAFAALCNTTLKLNTRKKPHKRLLPSRIRCWRTPTNRVLSVPFKRHLRSSYRLASFCCARETLHVGNSVGATAAFNGFCFFLALDANKHFF